MADSEGLYTGHPDVKYPDRQAEDDTSSSCSPSTRRSSRSRNQEIKKRFVELFGA